MAHCIICDKDFASNNSLRSHRSRYHKVPDVTDSTESEDGSQYDAKSQETTEKDSRQLKYDQNSQSTVEDTDQEDTDEEAATSDELHRDALSSKRKHSDIDEENPSKNQHIYKKISGIHDILKNHLEDKVHGSLFCYVMKREIERFVPAWFDTEAELQEALTDEQYVYVNMIRSLTFFSDVHMVFNDKKDLKTLMGIFDVLRQRPKRPK